MKKFYIFLIAMFLVSVASAQSCLPEGIIFHTQAEIDNFQINYPSCKGIEGSVLIIQWGGSITNLNGLNVISSISGSLSIKNNDALYSLTGLDSLDSIGGYLLIENNDALTSMAGLDNLISLGGSLSINSNENLISLAELENLNSLGGTYGSYLYIGDNPALNSLTGLDNVSWPNMINVQIINNCSLSTCEVQAICDQMYYGGCTAFFDIYNNATGCNSIGEVEAGCGVCGCSNYGIHLSTQVQIDNFQINYPNCSKIAGALWIEGNDITNLYGLSDLTNIRGNGGETQSGLNINGTNLASLMGLENLTYIATELEIYWNDSLTSLSGIDSVFLDGTLDIKYNFSLSDCDVQSICNYLTAPTGNYYIYANASGCNNTSEVRLACETISVEELNPLNGFSIYPNPSNDILTVESFGSGQLYIYNINGQQLISRCITEPQTVIDISMLPRGVYFVRITSDKKVMVGKFVKQ